MKKIKKYLKKLLLALILSFYLIFDKCQAAYFIERGQTNVSILISFIGFTILIITGLIFLYFDVKKKK